MATSGAAGETAPLLMFQIAPNVILKCEKTMSEEKDDFLREIDELLGDIEDEPTSLSTPLANGSTHDSAVGDLDQELEDTFKDLTVESNHHEPPPKTG